MQILEDLWYGQIQPGEMLDYRQADYRELGELFMKNREKLLCRLSQEQLEDFQKIQDLWEELGDLAQCAAFIAGFRLAVQLMAASV